jgi:pilus assembly protein CpaE
MTTNNIYTLIVSSQSETIAQLQRIFAAEKSYYVQFANSARDTLQIVAQDILDIDLLIVDDALEDATALETIRKLAIVIPSTPIIALADQSAVAYVREALLAGARAFLTKPLHDSEVISTLHQLIQVERARTEKLARLHPESVTRHTCEIVTILSPKGGTGCTMLAVNLAVAIRQQTNKKVILVDGQSALGDLEATLNLNSQFNGGDLVGHGSNLDADLVRGILTEHSTGISVFPSSHQLEDGEQINSEVFEKVIYYLSRGADYVIIDAGTVFEDVTTAALTAANKILLVITPEITALRRSAYFLQSAERNDFPRDRFVLLVNRSGIPGGLSDNDISNSLNMRIAESFPDDPGLVTYSLNRGVPLVISNPRSALAKRISRFAQTLAPQVKETSSTRTSVSILERIGMKWRSSPAQS